MNARLSHIAAAWLVPVLLGSVGAVASRHYLPQSIASQAARQAAIAPPVQFKVVNVSLPPGEHVFPPGRGSEIANANCVICHSTAMVLRQPPLTVEEWKIEVMKMRNAFGASIPLEQVDALAQYLFSVDGRKSDAGPSGVDKQAS